MAIVLGSPLPFQPFPACRAFSFAIALLRSLPPRKMPFWRLLFFFDILQGELDQSRERLHDTGASPKKVAGSTYLFSWTDMPETWVMPLSYEERYSSNHGYIPLVLFLQRYGMILENVRMTTDTGGLRRRMNIGDLPVLSVT